MERNPVRATGVFLSALVSLALCAFSLQADAQTRRVAPERQAAPAPKAVHVLCYHAFLDNGTMYSFTLAETEQHIRFFLQKGFRFLTVRDVVTGNYAGTKNILITIDDGNRSVVQAYYSVFKKFGIFPLLAIYPSIIGKVDYAMTWSEVKKLASEGCPIASHGYTHQYVNKKLYNSNRKMFDREIIHSKAVLEKELGRAISIFVYPFGVHSPVTVEKVREAGYRYAFSIQGGHLDPEDFVEGGLKLPRYLMTRKNAEGLLAYISRDAEKLLKAKNSVIAEKPARPRNDADMTTGRPARPDNHKKNIMADKPARPRNEKKASRIEGRALLPVSYPVALAGEASPAKHEPVQAAEPEPLPVQGDVLCDVKSSVADDFSLKIAGKGLSAAGSGRDAVMGMGNRLRERCRDFMNSSSVVYLHFVEIVRSRVFILKKSLLLRVDGLTRGK